MTDTSKVRYVFPLNVPWQQCSQTAPVMHYSSGGDHFGWDVIPTNGGSPKVLAACGGEVVEVQHLTTSYGQHVWILGDDGLYYVYAHMQAGSICVSEGQRVESGNVLGTMGGTGNVTGPHLHLGIQKTLHGFTGDINPATFLGFKDAVAPIEQLGSGNAQNSTGTDAAGSSSVPYEEENWDSIDILDVVDSTFEKGEYLYGRKCRVLVAAEDGTAVDLSNLHVVFSLQKTYLKDIQFSVVDIYNVSRETENFIISKAYQITIEAGYEGKYYGHIYTGDVVQAYGYNENGTDFVMRIVSADNERFMSESFVNFSWMRGMTQRDQATNLVTQATVPTTLKSMAEDAQEISLPRGKAFFGMAYDYLSNIAKNVGGSLYNDNGTVNIVKAEELPDNRIFNLNPQTGLIGVPQQEDMGISGKCLLIPQITINSAIRVENQYIQQKQLSWGSTGVSSVASATGTSSGTSGSQGIRDFIKSFESLSLTAYHNPGETYWTIGWGHYGSDVYEGMTITEEQAEAFLTQDMQEAADYVDNTTYCPFTSTLNSYERDALISFTMNTGQGWLKLLCGGGRTKEDIPDHIMAYCHGAVSGYEEGLTKRRRAELSIFQTGSAVVDGVTYTCAGSTNTSAADVYSTSSSDDSVDSSLNPLDESQIYRVVKLKYNGDTRGENWYIEFEGYRQTGQVPALLNTTGES